MTTTPFKSIEWKREGLRLLDQKVLPHRTEYVLLTTYEEVVGAIKDMTVRGAPAIAIAGAYGACLAVRVLDEPYSSQRNGAIERALLSLEHARPTAVNLSWAIKKVRSVFESNKDQPSSHIFEAFLSLAHEIYREDIETNKSIARHAMELVPDTATVIHHCNTGSLATADYGTALGVIRYAHEQGKKIHAYLDETRPRLQGASLSAYELKAYGVPHTVIVDSASGLVMRKRSVDLCIVGCDRVTARGDVVNKIGTYNLALIAKAHNVPLFVACPLSSIDLTLDSGDDVEIEERASSEVTRIGSSEIAPDGTKVFNPAFDVTPHELVTAIITEVGVLRAPYRETIRRACGSYAI